MTKTQQQTQATPATQTQITYKVKGVEGNDLTLTLPKLFKFGSVISATSKVKIDNLNLEINFKFISETEAKIGDLQYLPELDLTMVFVGDGVRNNSIWVKKGKDGENWLLCSGSGQAMQSLLKLMGISDSKALAYYDWLVWTRKSSPRNPNREKVRGTTQIVVENVKDLLGL